jgi:BASS family bile acid:Na+ symporter
VSPGGALSNTFTHLVRGNLGFSVMMTTVSTILVSATAPVVLAAAHTSGMLDQGAAARLDPVTVTFDLLRITLLPIGLGVLAVNFLPGAAARLRRAADALGIVAIATVLLSSTVVSLPALHQTAPGPLLLALLFSLGSLSLGILASRALPRADRSACFMEFGVRNLPVALVLTSGGSPTVELVAFLLCYLVVNASILVAVALLARSRIGSVAA